MEDNSEYFKYFVYDPLVTTGLRWRLDMYGGIHYSALLRKAGYIAFILFMLAVIGIGGVLTVITAGIALVGYYPIQFSDWVLSKVRSISAKRVLSKVFKKGIK